MTFNTVVVLLHYKLLLKSPPFFKSRGAGDMRSSVSQKKLSKLFCRSCYHRQPEENTSLKKKKNSSSFPHIINTDHYFDSKMSFYSDFRMINFIAIKRTLLSQIFPLIYSNKKWTLQ